jgi:hypothetical protein
LSGPGDPVMATSNFENVRAITGLSYSIPCKRFLYRGETLGFSKLTIL